MNNSFSRRQLLRSGAACLALPFIPSLMKAETATNSNTTSKINKACFINMGNGLLPGQFFPEAPGSNFKASPYLAQFGQDIKKKMVVFNGLSHKNLQNHFVEHCILTGVHKGRKDKTSAVSVDTLFGDRLGGATRFPVLSAWPFSKSFYKTPSITFDHKGLPIEPTKNTLDLYNKLFLNKQISSRKQQQSNDKMVKGQSILDDILSEQKTIDRKINISEKQILEDYYTSIREVEIKIAKREAWFQTARTKFKVSKPKAFEGVIDLEDLEYIQTEIYDLFIIALISDATSVVSMHYAASDQPLSVLVNGKMKNMNVHNNYFHHGGDPNRIKQLINIEMASVKAIAHFVKKLNARHILDETMVFLSSNLGNSSNHSGKDLPIAVMGAGFEKEHNNYYDLREEGNSKVQTPLCNLFQSMLHKIGDQNEKFSIGTGPLKCLKS